MVRISQLTKSAGDTQTSGESQTDSSGQTDGTNTSHTEWGKVKIRQIVLVVVLELMVKCLRQQ